MVPRALLVSLFIRSLSLLLPQTFFQPDEFYQALEPAHSLVFGHGHLTWEWLDLPLLLGKGEEGGAGAEWWWWQTMVVGGRMRSWAWPGVFAVVYELLRQLGLDGTELIVLAPRIVGILVAALTDYSTYLLAAKVLGPGSASGALFLSVTSLFHAHLLPRALSTSPETLLTTLALALYPLTRPRVPSTVVIGASHLVASQSMKDVHVALDVDPMSKSEEDVVKVGKIGEINYAVLDRMGGIDDTEPLSDTVVLAAALAALSISIRPTMLVFWAYIHLEQTVAACRRDGAKAGLVHNLKTLLGGITVLAASTLLDWRINGRVTFPILTFVHQNIVLSLSSFYGTTGLTYHLTQSLPILLFPLWYWWAQGYAASLVPKSLLPHSLATLDTPPALRSLARATLFTVAALSLSPHSEWRFLHPLLPQLLLFALPVLQRAYVPTIFGIYFIGSSLRQYCRLPPRAFKIIMLAPVIPYLYLNIFHGAAQVGVINALRRGDLGPVTGVIALMPCHSTPWSSHLHTEVPGWFLTCVPPLADVDPAEHWTQQALFYDSPVSYIEQVFPYPPEPLHLIEHTVADPHLPSHVLLFGDVLGATEVQDKGKVVSVRQALVARGYDEARVMWNGFDWAQDEEKRRGGVRVWVKRGGAERVTTSW